MLLGRYLLRQRSVGQRDAFIACERGWSMRRHERSDIFRLRPIHRSNTRSTAARWHLHEMECHCSSNARRMPAARQLPRSSCSIGKLGDRSRLHPNDWKLPRIYRRPSLHATDIQYTDTFRYDLTLNINYHMRTFIFCLLVLLSSTAHALTISGTATGNWSASSTWSDGNVPTSADDVIIKTGVAVTIDTAASCLTLTNSAGGTGYVTNSSGTHSLTISGTNTGIQLAGNDSTHGLVYVTGGSLSITGNCMCLCQTSTAGYIGVTCVLSGGTLSLVNSSTASGAAVVRSTNSSAVCVRIPSGSPTLQVTGGGAGTTAADATAGTAIRAQAGSGTIIVSNSGGLATNARGGQAISIVSANATITGSNTCSYASGTGITMGTGVMDIYGNAECTGSGSNCLLNSGGTMNWYPDSTGPQLTCGAGAISAFYNNGGNPGVTNIYGVFTTADSGSISGPLYVHTGKLNWTSTGSIAAGADCDIKANGGSLVLATTASGGSQLTLSNSGSFNLVCGGGTLTTAVTGGTAAITNKTLTSYATIIGGSTNDKAIITNAAGNLTQTASNTLTSGWYYTNTSGGTAAGTYNAPTFSGSDVWTGSGDWGVTGSLITPTLSAANSQIVQGNTIHGVAGNQYVPATSNVLYGVLTGTGTGAYVVPPVSEVLYPNTFGVSGGSQGTYYGPSASQVQQGVNFGVNDATTGTYRGPPGPHKH